MTAIFEALGLVAICFTLALSMDGAISRTPLEKLANFPFKGMPATNGMTFAATLLVIAVVIHFLLSGPGKVAG